MIKNNASIKLILFDVDGTVTRDCREIPVTMARAIAGLPQSVGFISGTDLNELRRILGPLRAAGRPIYILPEYGQSCWTWDGLLYDKSQPFPPDLADRLRTYFNIAMDEVGVRPLASDVYNHRHSQLTVSIIGRSAPGDAKSAVDPGGSIRRKLIHRVTELMKKANETTTPMFTLGGTSSIDVLIDWWTKREGVETLLQYLDQDPKEVLFMGDGVHPGMNDWPVTYTGVSIIKVSSPIETLRRLTR